MTESSLMGGGARRCAGTNERAVGADARRREVVAMAATAVARVLRLLRQQVIGADVCIFVRLWMRRNSVRGSSGWLIENEHVLCEIKQIRGLIRTKYSEWICSDLGPMPTQQSSEVVSALPPINDGMHPKNGVSKFCGWTTWRKNGTRETTALD